VCSDDFAVVDITADPELERRYRTRIPVVTVDGVERFWFEVAEEDLRDVV
jgi:hypothetical protein